MKKTLVSIVLMLTLMLEMIPLEVHAEYALSFNQQSRADYIAEVVTQNWDTYGVLPSIAVAQAMVESGIGEQARSYNYWGIDCGATYYGTLDEGIYGYMKCINNGYYDNALFVTDYRTQIYYILEGGYCYPINDYYVKAVGIIERYQLYKYDQILFNQIEEKKAKEKREKIQTEEFTLRYNPFVKKNHISVSKKAIIDGTVCIYHHNELISIYDVESFGEKKHVIGINDKSLDGMKVHLVVHEDAVG